DPGHRQVVLQAGEAVANEFPALRTQVSGLAANADDQLKSAVQNADDLANQVASLNSQIATTEAGSGGTANALRDQRDAALGQLAKLMDVKTVAQANGTVDVYVGSEPLVTGTISNGVQIRQGTVDGQVANVV